MYSGPSGLPSASRSAAVGSVMAQPPPGMLANPMDVDMADMSMADPDVKTFPDLPGAPYDPSSTGTSNTPLSISAMGNGNTMIGAGPMPTGFGMQNPSGTGSTLTEFTKRRNWSKLVLEELRDLMLVLSSDGRILHVSPSCKLLTGYDAFEMVGKFVSDFIHEDDKSMFVREFNESIASGHQMRFFYRLLRQDGSYQIFEAFGHPHHSSEAFSFGRGGAPYCRGYFMMSRPYPTKNAALLDSFLDHKIENERLLKRIADLKKEEQEEELEQESLWRSQEQGTETESLHGTDPIGGSDNGGTMMDTMPPPARPDVTGNPLTRQNLDEVLAAARPDSINDKMARYEGNSHIETIEMLTGLRYRDGERSQGISTGAPSPALIRGDAGIAILVDRESRSSNDRKKKTKVADEFVCTDCGTLDSPEWRKGPNGPKTLCNACGLRWAKKEKKRQQVKTTSVSKPTSTSS